MDRNSEWSKLKKIKLIQTSLETSSWNYLAKKITLRCLFDLFSPIKQTLVASCDNYHHLITSISNEKCNTLILFVTRICIRFITCCYVWWNLYALACSENINNFKAIFIYGKFNINISIEHFPKPDKPNDVPSNCSVSCFTDTNTILFPLNFIVHESS